MIRNSYFRGFLFTLLILFPGLANLYKSMGSGTLVLMTLAGLGVVFQKPRPSFSRNEKWLMTVFAAYMAIYLLSAVVNSLTGVLGEIRGTHFEKKTYLLTFIPIYFLFRCIHIPAWVLWWGVALGGMLVGCYALIDFGWVDIEYRVRGAYNPIMFGCLSLTMAFMAIQGYHYFRRQHLLLIIVPLAGFFLGTVSSILTGSRGAWIAIPAFLGITLYHLGKNLRRLELALIIGTFGVALLAAYHIPETGVAQRFQFAQNDLRKFAKGDVTIENSVGLRLASWDASWQMVKGHLLLGIGPGGYHPTILRMSREGQLPYAVDVYHTQPHSIYFAVLVDCGVVGIGILLSVFILPVYIFFQRIRGSGPNKPAAYAGLILAMGYIHFGLTETIFGRNLFVAFFVIMLAMLMALTTNQEEVNY
jgi:O-antigen ligase